MIRLPPSSISLSAVDIDFGLRQADIYYGLLRQGFKKHDIARYLNDHRQAQAEAHGLPGTEFNISAPSTFELTSRQVSPRPQDEGDQEKDVPQVVSSNRTASSDCGSGSSSYAQDVAYQECKAAGNHEDSRSPSPKTTVPTMRVNRHAPRKSSLLRFFRAASPEKQSPEGNSESVVDSPKHTAARNSSRRSLTHFWRTPEPEEADSDIPEKNSLADKLMRLSLESTGRKSDSTIDLPPIANTYTLPDSPGLGTSEAFGGSENISDIRSPSKQDQGLRSSRLPGVTGSSTYLPSSPPPVPDASPVESSSFSHALSASPEFPVTPTPIRNAASYPRTEPHRVRHQYLDGSGFSVYNDSLPAVSQPQTPADLARGPFLTEQDAAYTAPPGMLLVGSGSVSAGDTGRWDRGVSEQSPTARAISLRERRNRELLRGVRAEGVRLQRLRMRDEAMFTRRADAANPPEGDGTDERFRAAAETFQDAWRDDLDADRVGEENFESEASESHNGGMRVVSGNARFIDAWEGGLG
ncbi:hypothetical protein PV08_02767 [Exophiala spinifera]|uniref:Uncharacterized protein n=1 Tax=Exophiala spinifera TaxID=91928 RepID=A0A0D2C4G8_9EURO|nr:uncharacterized protein PV08_02767 [Exophiala spinifera]KIW18479.1 hypothetical protein PV08_02767 [Exophiala spinifera]